MQIPLDKPQKNDKQSVLFFFFFSEIIGTAAGPVPAPLNGTESTWLAPRSGIPQGTVLGPMLFLIYINDLPTQLESSCAIFADDTTVHAASSDSKLSCARISADLDVAAEWADSWGMLFSAEKSEHLHIGKATGQRVTMRGVPIPQVKHHRHLGVVMNNKLTWTGAHQRRARNLFTYDWCSAPTVSAT